MSTKHSFIYDEISVPKVKTRFLTAQDIIQLNKLNFTQNI